ncbi:sulfurtransferase TusA family protein [Wielerella bovis]|uniref:sulfurtransferase TusA family protein n=1 Tax=Wielerella bovis TaxID=2917790 RepID=UPI002019A9D7|nr:sulfurtransferase TusA family protein [Wielerella bovis]MCG7656329.1 sulfurtransferase TusA family protein [Wielerella bovis]MCG7658554.1 sulfurtransferase TusA family protein [Wielerella bovis]ULJ60663.1 sulfurtransferase TusA family protein [Wielerella bovis]ULJ62853.1 sulfurtransferase TusA family protein [Wielerella bovis]ULJ65083.1 sulfurtransferase TusA family protein [Wielerella bovis]
MILDVKGLKCPMPMLRAKKMLATMESGAILTVLATDAGAPDDFAAFCRHTGHELLASNVLEDGIFELIVKHK